MDKLFQNNSHIKVVSNFYDLVSEDFIGDNNAMCWRRELEGDFYEIISKFDLNEDLIEIQEDDLSSLQLSKAGNQAREILLNDFKLLRENGSLPSLNIIIQYEHDDSLPFFSTDVYSFHVDRSPIPTSTFLCTYYGDASEIIPNSLAVKKVLIPSIRSQLKELYEGDEDGFGDFLTDNFYDLHYEALPEASPIKLGLGNLWRLAIEHPESKVLPCIHRAPLEKSGKPRLLMIC
ncbi:MAG: hypothetical protein RLZZ546_1224 [Bacteroidota bacterium]|jgi:hypothetical protein